MYEPRPFTPLQSVNQVFAQTDFSWLKQITPGGENVVITEPTEEEKANLLAVGVVESFRVLHCGVQEQFDVVKANPSEVEALKARLPEDPEMQDIEFVKVQHTITSAITPSQSNIVEFQLVPLDFVVNKLFPALKGQYRGIDVDPETGFSEPLTRILKEAEADAEVQAQLERDAFEAVMKQQAQAQAQAEVQQAQQVEEDHTGEYVQALQQAMAETEANQDQIATAEQPLVEAVETTTEIAAAEATTGEAPKAEQA